MRKKPKLKDKKALVVFFLTFLSGETQLVVQLKTLQVIQEVLGENLTKKKSILVSNSGPYATKGVA